MTTDPYDFSGRVALVTGGGSGLGREVAIGLGKLGASVVVAGRRPDPLQETVDAIHATGHRALAVPTDVTDSSQVNALVDRTVSHFGRIDILINNAGISGADDPEKAVWEISDEVWHRGIDGELTGSLLLRPCRGKVHGRAAVWEDSQRLLGVRLRHAAWPGHVRCGQGGRPSSLHGSLPCSGPETM